MVQVSMLFTQWGLWYLMPTILSLWRRHFLLGHFVPSGHVVYISETPLGRHFTFTWWCFWVLAIAEFYSTHPVTFSSLLPPLCSSKCPHQPLCNCSQWHHSSGVVLTSQWDKWSPAAVPNPVPTFWHGLWSANFECNSGCWEYILSSSSVRSECFHNVFS